MSDAYDGIGPKYMRSLNYHAAHDIGHALQDLAMVGCTSFAAKGVRTGDGQLLVARNFDFWMGDDFSREKLITFIRPKEGIPHVLVGWGGFMGAVSGTRDILQHAATITEAVAIAEKHDVFVSESILVASARDGRAAIIEKAPDGMGVYDPGGDLLTCANHYQSERFLNSEANQANIKESDSMARFRRMEQLVDSAGALDPVKAAAILRDRNGMDDAPIGLGNPMAINQMIAHHGVIMRPADRLFWVSAWPYQMGAFVGYDLRDVFARCASDSPGGPINDPALTIAADPFLAAPAFTEQQWWQEQRTRIALAAMTGQAITFTPADEARFQAAAPDSYITRMALGDLHRLREENAAAAAHYSAALALPVASAQERTRLEERLRECNLAAASR